MISTNIKGSRVREDTYWRHMTLSSPPERINYVISAKNIPKFFNVSSIVNIRYVMLPSNNRNLLNTFPCYQLCIEYIFISL